MGTNYETDVVAWAIEQAAMLRAGKFSALDIEHIAEEIESVGRSEQRHFASDMAVLVANLIRWKYQSGRRSPARRRVIRELRRILAIELQMAPALKSTLTDPHWATRVWGDAICQSVEEIGVALPDTCPWTMEQVIDEAFLPELRGADWQATLQLQRGAIARRLRPPRKACTTTSPGTPPYTRPAAASLNRNDPTTPLSLPACSSSD
jgi:hypothetical protein